MLRIVFTSCFAAFQCFVHAEEIGPLELAVQRGLSRVTLAATNWQENQSCFSCHHQTLPMLAARESELVGFVIDRQWLKSQATTSLAYFEERTEDMNAGDHVPGGAATTGFGFWAISLDDRPSDDTTTSMVRYLLQIQGVVRLREAEALAAANGESTFKNDGHWQASCRRAPMQASAIGDTVLALIAIEKYATKEQRSSVDKARKKAVRWLNQAPLRTQQDRLWRLWGLHHLGGEDAMTKQILGSILDQQREDGGWAETKDRKSDTYSTGQTLYMLLKTGVSEDHPSIRLARDYLLKEQHADGSWFAESHVIFKAQPYFDNGDPYGKNQFLSTAATAWATAGLAQLLPEKK